MTDREPRVRELILAFFVIGIDGYPGETKPGWLMRKGAQAATDDFFKLLENEGLALLASSPAPTNEAVDAGVAAFRETVAYWAPELMGSPPHIEKLVANILAAGVRVPAARPTRPALTVESSIAKYEWLADEFYLDTGMMAPGKDQPAALGGRRPEERDAAWIEWLRARSQENKEVKE